MFITKKNLEKKLEEAQKEVYEKFERRDAERDMSRWTDERFRDTNRRMDTAFTDIDHRLSALEQAKNPANEKFAVCSRY